MKKKELIRSIDFKNVQLSDEQLEAVENVSGPQLLLAVPGSGKTTTLIARLIHMIRDENIDPRGILVITFTNAAAADMKNRFFQMHQDEQEPNASSGHGDVSGVTFSTINGLCLRICLSYARIYHRAMPDLISEPDRRAAIAAILRKNSGEYTSDSDIRDASQKITYIKNMGLTEKDIKSDRLIDSGDWDVYREYSRTLKSRKLMDYDDQIVFAAQILRDPRFSRVLDRYRSRFRWLMVDEAQDTSKLQHQIIRTLAGGRRNIFMVGDEDQSIYGFRAAFPQALLDFHVTWPEAEIHRLQTNYRSGKEIVEAASRVIVHNKNRYEKNMVAARTEAGACRAVAVRRREDQYDEIIRLIGERDEKTAILYRDNSSALPLILRLERAGIPYELRGQDAGFFSNRIVREASDILTFALDPLRRDILWKIYYKFGVKISKKAMAHAMEDPDWAGDDPYLDALAASPALGKSAREDLRVLQDQFRTIRQRNDARFALRCLRNAMSYRNASSEKLFIMQALAEEGESIPEFFQKLHRMSEAMDGGHGTGGGNVVLSTVHGSKGLEYPKVIIMDAVQGILPSGENDEEEERRIFYVAVTRAMDTLVMMKYGDVETPFPDQALGIRRNGPIRISEADRKEAEGFEAGSLVSHRSFGTGRIVSIDKDGRADIDFGGRGKKKMSLQACVAMGIIKKLK
ncbi:UvrD-helicase domain-containing protein, partial [Mobilibacterium timonense]|uniref:ATP-dependent helicase n=1 Tax=Mobilibacterium timonense TaxID=1871012 RepID=UPI003A8F77FE